MSYFAFLVKPLQGRRIVMCSSSACDLGKTTPLCTLYLPHICVPLYAEPVIPGCFNEMGQDGSMTVRAASVFTWVCQQGECATQSPLFSQYDLAHPVDE